MGTTNQKKKIHEAALDNDLEAGQRSSEEMEKAPESPIVDFKPVGFQDIPEENELPENLVTGRMYIFSALSSLEEIMGVLCTAFGVSPEGQKDTLELHNGDMAIHVSVACESEGEGAKKFIGEQIQGTWTHFYEVKTGAVDVKTNLLYQIGWSTAFLLVEYAFIPDEDLDKKVDIEDMFVQTLDNLEGVMLIQDEEDQIFCQGEYGERLLVLSDTGGSAFRRYLPYQAAVLKAGGSISQEQYDRRMRSRNVLEEQCIYVPAAYPVIERAKDISCPSSEDIAKRAVALLCVSVYSEFLLSREGSPEKAQEFVEDIIDRYDAREFFSPKEWAYLSNPETTKQEKVNFAWQYENLLVMEWALGLVDKLDFPDHICDVAQVVGMIRDCDSIEEIVKKAKPRTPKELLDASDLIFCLDWACVNARIYKLPAPAGMEGGVVAERHKSLNWLTGYGDAAPWDEVRTDT